MSAPNSTFQTNHKHAIQVPKKHRDCKHEQKKIKVCEAQRSANAEKLAANRADAEAKLAKLRKKRNQLRARGGKVLKHRKELAAHVLAAWKYIRKFRKGGGGRRSQKGKGKKNDKKRKGGPKNGEKPDKVKKNQ